MDVDMQDPSTNPRPRDEADNSKPKGGVNGKKVAYYYDHDVGNFNYGLGHPMKPHRIRMAHNLVTNYGLLDKMDVFRPTRANPDQMTRFHSDEYVDFLEKVSPETVEELTGSGSRFLTGEDCPAFEGLFEFCSISAGGSICAAERLNSGAADIAVNWAGGLHHAKKREASGFCYVNDIVLGILELLRYHPRVLYIDIDVHHGDGVEEAFYSTDRVMTASFHKFGDFFPGTGDARDTGVGKGKDYAVNVPLRDGITDETYASIFEPVIQHIMDWFRPGAIVLQCGADSLSGDKLGTFNLSMKGHSDCVKFVQSFGVPMMVVGGGGYTTKNVARTWTYETGLVLGEDLNENLPYNDYLEYYGPRFKLEVLENNMENQNTPEYLNNLKSRVIDTLRSMPFAPSVGMQEVPGISLGRAVGVLGPDDDSEDDSDLDVQINQRLKQITASTARAADDSESNSEDDSSRRSRSRVPRSSSRRISASPFPQSSSHHHQNGSYSHSHASSSKPQPPSHLQNPYYPSSSSTNDISSSINRPSTVLDPSSSAFNGPIDFFAGASELAGGGAAGGRKKRTFFSIGEGRGAGGGSGGFRRNGGIGAEEGVYRGMAQGVYSGF